MQVRREENYRESWFVTNRTNSPFNIGDLPLVPTLYPGKPVDLLRYYPREKISHSIILTNLVKARKLRLVKKKIDQDAVNVSGADVEKAITPAEEYDPGIVGGVVQGYGRRFPLWSGSTYPQPGAHHAKVLQG